MRIKKLLVSPVFWSVVALISSACVCGEETSTQAAKVIGAPEEKQGKQEKQASCPMEWTSPTSSSDAGDMPPTGMVSFDWSDHPDASGYEMTLITPNNSPVYYDVDGSSKDLFLENYSQVGKYQLVLTALDTDGQPLCSISLDFNMPVVADKSAPNNNNSGDDESEPGSVSPSNPIIVPGIIIVPDPIEPPR